jgi:hypothetical protein
MVSVAELARLYRRLRERRWKIVNEAYGQIKISDYGYQLFARDGTVLSCGSELRHVWLTDRDGRALFRVLAEDDGAERVEMSGRLGDALDLATALLHARYNVVWCQDSGYLWDKAPLGGLELVFAWEGENEVRD